MSYRIPVFITAIAMGALSLSTLTVEAKGGPRGGERPDFSEIDANGDGALSEDEILAFMQTRGETRFDEADSNNDGQLSRDEMIAARDARGEARIDRMIDRLDENDDGQLSQEELQKVRERAEGRRGNRRGMRFERLDANGDGTISQEEWTAGPSRR